MRYTNSPLVSYINKSPNHSGLRTHSIDRITPHCVVGQCSIESLGNLFAQVSRRASSNYGIGVDGRVGLFVDESNKSWCSSSNANDQRAITIECASDAAAPYAFNTTVYNKLIDLCTDICKRNGKTKLLWFGDKDKTLNYTPKSDEMILTVHRWFANKSCPGDWMYTRMGELASKVTTKLNKSSGFNTSGESTVKYSRSAAANLINSWIGKKESDGSHKFIIDIYNTQNPLPRGYKVKYTDSWCATTTSAVAIKLGYTDIIPIECSVYYLIEIAKKMGIWQENDSYVPKIGDLVCYDWDDGANYASGNNMNAPDHVGMVTYVNKDAGYFVVTEGNYSDSVKKRTVSINGRYIRGFICPKYDDESSNSSVTDNNTIVSDSKKDDLTIAREVIAGVWGTGIDRKNRLEAAGYNYAIIQKLVNNILNGNTVTTSNTNQDQNQPVAKKVTATASARSYNKSLAGTYTTTADLHLRNDAGTNKKSLVIIPKNTKVNNYGYYTSYNGYKWLYIQVTIDGVQYTGFSHSNYLIK